MTQGKLKGAGGHDKKLADVLALVQRLNCSLVFRQDCDKPGSAAHSLSPGVLLLCHFYDLLIRLLHW